MKRVNISLICLFILNSFHQKGFANFSKIKPENISKIQIATNPKNKTIKYRKDVQIEINNFVNFLIASIENASNNSRNKINDLLIESDNQLRSDDQFIAQGNVIVRSDNAVLKANRLDYKFRKKILIVKGDINFKIEDQFLSASEIRYELEEKKGYILNPYGSINFETLGTIKIGSNKKNKNLDFTEKDKFIRNVILNNSNELGFNDINLNGGENESFFKRLTSQRIKLNLNQMQKWRFKAEKIEIENEKWISEELFLTNDPYNSPQIKIKNSKFVSINKDEEIFIKAKWSTLILDDKLNIPIGPRRIKVGDETIRWGLGYDQNKKDGLFIIRNSDPKYLFDKNTKINLKKEFYFQRAVQGYTKSFTEDQSSNSTKIKQDNKLSDLFGVEAVLKSKFYGFNLNSNITLNSLDFTKLNETLTSKNELSRKLFEENRNDFSKTSKLALFLNYNEKIWNGSIGEREILSAYGLKINKKNIWKTNKTNKSSEIALAYGNYNANKKSSLEEIISRDRLNIFLERSHSYPIWEKIESKLINKEFIYSPAVIQEGLRLNLKTKVDFYRYSDDNFQNLLTFKIGPELTLGSFKKKYFDYTKFSIYPKFTLAQGDSPFDFDQAVDNNIIEMSYHQQIAGPVTLKISSQYNLDVNSSKFKEISNLKYEVAWNRRAYNLSAYYNQDQKTGGINFKIYSFNFDGLGSRF